MIVLYILFYLLVTAGAVTALVQVHTQRKHKAVYGSPAKELAGMSWAGKELIKEYNAIPANNRPYANIKTVVTALDLKHGVETVDSHFRDQNGVYDRRAQKRTHPPSWDCRCYRTCDLDGYKSLHNSFTEITDALAQQQHALALSGVAEGFVEAGTLMERLREEKELIHTVTKELTK